MKSTYGQYCPLALAAEILCRRWIILVISRFYLGCTQFNEIHRSIPRISPASLSRRLSELVDAGIIERIKTSDQKLYSYHLTESGRALESIIHDMMLWGHKWGRDMVHDDLDLGFLAWSMHLRMNSSALPTGRTVIEFSFTGAPKNQYRFWLVSNYGEIDMCLKNPGFETDLFVTSDLKEFVETWRGFRDLRQQIRNKRIQLVGPAAFKKAFPDWLLLNELANLKRQTKGKERMLCEAPN